MYYVCAIRFDAIGNLIFSKNFLTKQGLKNGEEYYDGHCTRAHTAMIRPDSSDS